MEAKSTVHLMTLMQEAIQNCYRMWQELGVSVSKVRGNILKEISGNTFFNLIFLNF